MAGRPLPGFEAVSVSVVIAPVVDRPLRSSHDGVVSTQRLPLRLRLRWLAANVSRLLPNGFGARPPTSESRVGLPGKSVGLDTTIPAMLPDANAHVEGSEEAASERLRPAHGSGKPTVLSFINLKGGVGKTTTAIAVAEILAHEHRKAVLLIDLDPQTNATVTLIPEQRWAEMDRAGQTVAQLFEDYMNPQYPKRFDIETAIARRVSTVADGIEGLDLLPSSIRLIDIQERIPMIAVAGHFTLNPLDVLQAALQPVLARYDYIIIDCPPSLGTVTKNGLRISTGYVIPTIPDTLSTWGIYQIVDNVERFAKEIDVAIRAIGVVATKVQGNNLHARVIDDMRGSRLGRFGEDGRLKQPPMFGAVIPQSVAVARAADILAGLRTLRLKYGDAYTPLTNLTQEIIDRCETKSL